MAQVPNFTSATASTRPAFCWYNETTSAYIGSEAAVYQANDAAGFGAFGGMSEAVITTTQSTVVSFRILSLNAAISGLGGNTDFSTTGSYPWFDIEVISGYSPLVNGTSGSSGTSGTGVPAWTSAGVITLTATTTSPVKGTTTSDNIRYRQVGAKEWEIVLTYIQTVASGNSGSGDYLITLPNSLSFDTSLPSQQIYTGSVGTSTFALAPYIIPSGNGMISNTAVGGHLFPIIYSSTRFRVFTASYWNNTGIQCWGSGFYSVGGDTPRIQLTFSFTST